MKTLKNLRNIFASTTATSTPLVSFIAVLLVVLSALHPAQAFENEPKYKVGQFEIQTYANYFKTDGNYKSGGSKDSLPSDFSYQLIDTNVRTRFVMMEDWGLFGSLNVGNSESKDNIKTLTNSTLNWASLGTDYRWLSGDWTLVTDIDVIIPFEKVASDTEASLNWDGAIHVRPRVLLQYDFGIFQPYGYLGIEYRDKGLSTSALYGGGMAFDMGSFELGAELNGYSSIKDDQYTNEVNQREGIINNFNANSKKFYSINPSLLDSDIFARYKFLKNWMIQIGGGLTLTGSESASGYHASALVKFQFGGGEGSASHRHEHPSLDSGSKNSGGKGFQEDVDDGVNQGYFKPAPPVVEKAKDPSTTENPSKAEDDYKIELKSKKKKK